MESQPEPTGPPAGAVGAVLRGALGFTVVSLIAFSVWAFGGRAFVHLGGEPVMYAVIALVFLALTGLVLHPLVRGPRSLPRFYQSFMPAFFAYALVWSALWFALGSGLGEWLGSLVGSALMVAVTGWRLKAWNGWWVAWAVFFVLHTAGYFAGGWMTQQLMIAARQMEPERARLWRRLAMLSWGLGYGLGFGAALGFLYHWLQSVTVHRPGGGAPAAAR